MTASQSTAAGRRSINCDFFRVRFEDNRAEDFAGVVLGMVGRLKTSEERNVVVPDGVLRMANCGEVAGGDSICGTLMRLRIGAAATVGNMSHDDLRDLALGPGEALTEYFCFCYVKEYQTLVVHRNRDAGGPGRLAFYVTKTCSRAPVYFEPILNTDAFHRLSDLRDFTIAEVQLAMPNNQTLVSDDVAVSSAIDIGNRTAAATVSLKVSVGRHRKRHLSEAVREMVKAIRKLPPAAVKKALIVGHTDDGGDSPIEIDLIADRMRQRVDVLYEGLRPAFTDYYDALRQAYSSRRSEIRDQFHQE